MMAAACSQHGSQCGGGRWWNTYFSRRRALSRYDHTQTERTQTELFMVYLKIYTAGEHLMMMADMIGIYTVYTPNIWCCPIVSLTKRARKQISSLLKTRWGKLGVLDNNQYLVWRNLIMAASLDDIMSLKTKLEKAHKSNNVWPHHNCTTRSWHVLSTYFLLIIDGSGIRHIERHFKVLH